VSKASYDKSFASGGGEPRLLPVVEPTEEQLKLMHTSLERGDVPLNIFATLAHNPALLQRVNRLGGYFLFKGSLDPREREIVILRTSFRSGCRYEFGQHRLIGREAGLSDEEIRSLSSESAGEFWSDRDRPLIDLVDELAANGCVSSSTWQALASRWSEVELVELLLLPGYYRMLADFLNSVGVELDNGVPGWPEADGD
jgi:4-carboxymuconolactone decarboxylase